MPLPPPDWRYYVGVGALFGALALVLAALDVRSPRVDAWAAAGLLLALGALCTWSGVRCGERHCLVTGPAYLLLSLAAALMGLGAMDVRIGLLWALLGAAFVLGLLLERALASDEEPSLERERAS